MAAGACLIRGVWQANKQSHYRSVHQRFTKVHFGCDEMTVERNNKTGRFDCPRCKKSYPEPSGLHKHARSRQSHCSSGPQRLRGGHHNRMNMPGRAEKSNASYVPIDIPSLDVPESSSSTASRRSSQ
ncbi:hypothetical protein DAEQUDRAFT_461724 [Daedalea quercina L-15889]|uniref:C2H2-type domain-containing protein n=1 Tax=Daedalea quercina L-15889 TaxID=1314783 RepID=A0A165TDA5_9APHY|nr:hypothetical protein DAEQUDRAFT_461724 [Daedalea quercina L-15889]